MPQNVTIGSIIAGLVLVVAVVFVAIGQLDIKVGVLIAALALARLIP